LKILVIEDEKMLADTIKSLLERKGFQVEAVYDGESGEQYAELGIEKEGDDFFTVSRRNMNRITMSLKAS